MRQLNYLILAACYTLLVILIYVLYLNPVYGYIHFNLLPRSIFFIIFSSLLAIFPVIFYNGQRAISSYIAIIIYLITYVPTIITLMFALNRSLWEVALVQSCFTFVMILIIIADRVNIKNFIGSFKNKISIQYLNFIILFFTLIVIYSYSGHLNFVSFAKVYELRASNNQLGINPFVGYIVMWLTYCFYPIYLTLGLLNKKWLYFIAGCVGEIIIYMCTGAKLALLSPVFIWVIYFVGRKNINRLFSFSILSFTIFSTILLILLGTGNKIIYWMSFIVFLRIVGIGGLSNFLYYDFFSTHEFTYYSHLNIVNFFTKSYPYGTLGLGQVIGKAFYGSSDQNSNANFWAMDGIASCGLTGVIIISLVLFFFLVFLNMITKGMNKLFLILIFTSFALTLTNLSLFTTLLSGGGLLLLIILIFFQLDISNKLKTGF